MAKSRSSGAGNKAGGSSQGSPKSYSAGSGSPTWFDRMQLETDSIKQMAQKARYRNKGETGYWNGDKIKYAGLRENAYGAEWETFTFLEGRNKGKQGTQMTMFDEVRRLNEDAKNSRLDREAKSRLQKTGGFNVKWG